MFIICRLDSRPKKMFANFVRRTMEDNVYKITYLDDLKMFEFGPIFVGPNRIYEEHYTIDLKNASLITADVEIEFLEDTSVFQIDKTSIRLEVRPTPVPSTGSLTTLNRLHSVTYR